MRKPTIPGVVLECLPNLQYRVELQGGRVLRCYLGGKMRLNKVKVLVGDRVEVEHNATMGEIGRISWRHV